MPEQTLLEASAFNHFIIAHCIESCIHHSRTALDIAFDDAQNQIRRSLEGKRLIRSQAHDDMRLLLDVIHSGKATIIQSIISNLADYLNYSAFLDAADIPKSPISQGAPISPAKLCLDLFATAFARDIAFKTHNDLSVLNLRMAYLRGLSLVYPSWINPFKPDVFIRAICIALKGAGLNPVQKLIFLHAASAKLTTGIQAIYKDLLYIQDQNSIPSLPMSMTEYSFGFSFDDSINSLFEIPHKAPVIDFIVPSSPRIKTTNSANVTGFSDTEIVDLQTIMCPGGSIMSFLGSLKKSFPGVRSQKLTRAIDRLESTITTSDSSDKAIIANLTKRLLDAACNDARILPLLRSELLRMNQVMTKIGMVDPSFLTNKSHPARQFVELIAHKSLSYRNEDDQGLQTFLSSVRHVIDAFLVSKSHPLKTLAKANAWLEMKWVKPDFHSSSQDQGQSKDQTIIAARNRNIIATTVLSDLKKQIPNLDKAPRYVIEFVSGPWVNVIAFIDINIGVANRIFSREKAIDTVKLLVWSLSTKEARKDVQTYARVVLDIESQIIRGLSLLGVSERDMALVNFVGRMNRHHSMILVSAKSKSHQTIPIRHDYFSEALNPVPATQGEWLTPNESKVVGKLNFEAPPDFSRSDFLNTDVMVDFGDSYGSESRLADTTGDPFTDIKNASVNDWFEFFMRNAWHRVCLNWCNTSATQRGTMFMFQKASGDVITMTDRQFEKLIAKDRVRVVSDSPILSKALERLLA